MGGTVTLQELKQQGVIVLSPLKQNKLRSDTQHMSSDIKPYGRGAGRAIYLKVVVVIGRTNVIGLLTKQLGRYGSAKIRGKETIFSVSSFLNMESDVTF